VTEYERERRWETTAHVVLGRPSSRRVLFDRSRNDAYADPGNPVLETRPDGRTLMLQDGDWFYLAGRGASEAGDRPFLDRMSLKSLRKERLFVCDDTSYETFLAFAGRSRARILTRRETPSEPQNLFLVDLGTGGRTALTTFPDPAPQLTGVRKQLLKYRRADGVQLSGQLVLPPGYTPGTRLPLVVWAYPLEYSDPGTAGQVRGSTNTFTLPRGASQLFFVTQGYAVLNDATMPVIGDPETMNDTYIEQVVSSARAALDTLDAMGIVDRRRVLVGGHSYGAFMTANLLAHSDLFAAGIARSGAYNRSLTPFGFQSERRSYWEATELYTTISPFTHAHRIDEPLLLVHGQMDNNSGTYPMQSERLFEALSANGGTARLVMLPFESHGYRARESVLHVLAEMFEWADRWAKNRPAEAAAGGD
jgi:dipeptidyl aminopeptidase/acylaminoacyl peptidase